VNLSEDESYYDPSSLLKTEMVNAQRLYSKKFNKSVQICLDRFPTISQRLPRAFVISI